jgi:hypothetical protein
MTTETMDGDPGTSVTTYGAAEVDVIKAGEPGLVALVDEFDAELIVRGVDEGRIEAWCYGFKQAGDLITGLSIVGVAAAAREMAKHGEVLRADTPTVTFENDDEVRLVCTAHRFFVAPDGREVEVDSATRALRQLKYQMVWEYVDRQRTGRKIRADDPKWYEKAFSKAVRNATVPLIRDDCRSTILDAWRQTPKAQEVMEGETRGRPQRAPAGGQRPRNQRQRQTPKAQEEPAIGVPLTRETRLGFIQLYNDTLQTWDKPSFGALRRELAERWPAVFKATVNDLKALSDDQGQAVIAFLRERRGEGGPAEETPASCAHDFAFPPEGADVATCKKCGDEMPADVGAIEEAGDTAEEQPSMLGGGGAT